MSDNYTLNEMQVKALDRLTHVNSHVVALPLTMLKIKQIY